MLYLCKFIFEEERDLLNVKNGAFVKFSKRKFAKFPRKKKFVQLLQKRNIVTYELD